MLLKKNRIYINKLKAAKVPVLVAGLLVGISIFGVFVLNTSSVKASHALPANALLPDLVTHLSEQNNEGNGNTFNVDIVVSDGKRLFRLDNNIVNYSTGVLELRPVGEDCNGDGQRRNDVTAYQRVYNDSNGNGVFERGVDTGYTDVASGCMEMHAQHRHWHYENLAKYELRDDLGTTVASNVKNSFCVADGWRVSPILPGSPSSKYYTDCSRNSVQGLSVSWGDEYFKTTKGQHIEIGNLTGTYCLVSTADPDSRLHEANETNNTASVSVTLNGDNSVAVGAAGCAL